MIQLVLCVKEAKNLAMSIEPQEFEYSLRMRDGRYLRECIGTSVEDAARRAGEDPAQVRRALPVRKVLTAAEREARAARFETLRKKAKGEKENDP